MSLYDLAALTMIAVTAVAAAAASVSAAVSAAVLSNRKRRDGEQQQPTKRLFETWLRRCLLGTMQWHVQLQFKVDACSIISGGSNCSSVKEVRGAHWIDFGCVP